MDAIPAVKLIRVAKGKRPQYFSDPAIDKLLVMVLELTQELSVTRDRLDTVERLLDEADLLSAARIDGWMPDASAATERGARRAAMLRRIFRASQQELEEATGGAVAPAAFDAGALT